MINERDVIRMKVPYPNISSQLAVQAHMYICKSAENAAFSFIKCQTLKPYMLLKNPLKHYVDEYANVARNPFKRTTRIDCDKLFSTKKVNYSKKMCATVRADVCQELYDDVISELKQDGWLDIPISDEKQLANINPLITYTE